MLCCFGFEELRYNAKKHSHLIRSIRILELARVDDKYPAVLGPAVLTQKLEVVDEVLFPCVLPYPLMSFNATRSWSAVRFAKLDRIFLIVTLWAPGL